MSFLKEFREFAVKGNAFDLAIGVIIGTAFGKIVSSLVSDVLMPLIGILIGQIDFSALTITIGSAQIRYGLFLQSIVDFVIVALVIFLTIKQMNRFRKKAEPAASSVSAEVQLLTEIRDAVRSR